MSPRTRDFQMLFMAVMFLLAAPASFAQGGRPAPKGDMGVSLALQGESSRAESVFVSMLSHTRGDSRALNGLGNLRLLRGDVGVAMAFYDRALRGDSTDAGIHLNRATALMLMGDETRAREAARTAIKLAGGLNAAQALLGLAPEAADPGRAADKTALIGKDELRALLRSAATEVPSDTTRKIPNGLPPAKRSTSAWRQAGSRAADPTDNSSSANLLYWKP